MYKESIPPQSGPATHEQEPAQEEAQFDSFAEFMATVPDEAEIYRNNKENPTMRAWGLHSKETDEPLQVWKVGGAFVVDTNDGDITIHYGKGMEQIRGSLGFVPGLPYLTITGETDGKLRTWQLLAETGELRVYPLASRENDPRSQEAAGSPQSPPVAEKAAPRAEAKEAPATAPREAEPTEPATEAVDSSIVPKNARHEDYKEHNDVVGPPTVDLEALVVKGPKRSPIHKTRVGIYKDASPLLPAPGAGQAIAEEFRRSKLDGKVRGDIKKGDRPGFDKGWLGLGGEWEFKASKETKETNKYIVAERPDSPTRKGRVPIGKLGAHTIAAPENISVTEFGPPGAGKTREMKRMALEWLMSDSGFVVFYSTKAELDIIDVAEQFGPVHVFAPFGLGAQNKEIEQKLEPYMCKISPIDACKSWEDAKMMASSMVAQAQDGMKMDSNDNFFVTLAEDRLASAMWAAEKKGINLGKVVEVLKMSTLPDGPGQQELINWLTELKQTDRAEINKLEANAAYTELMSTFSQSEKTNSGIALQLKVILGKWSMPSVLASMNESTIDPDEMVNKPGTLIIVGTDSHERHGQIFASLVGRISRAVRNQQIIDPVTRRHVPAERGTAIFVDEAQNIGVDKTLVDDVVQGRGYGLVRVSGIQNGEAFGQKYGGATLETLVNSGVVVAKKGTDAHTAQLIEAQAGTYEYKNVDAKKILGGFIKPRTPGSIKEGVKRVEEAADNTPPRRLPCFTINDTKNLTDDQAIVMFQGGVLAKVETEPYYKDKYITGIKNRLENPVKVLELLGRVGVSPNDPETAEEVIRRFKEGQNEKAIHRAMARKAIREAASTWRLESQIEREQRARAKALEKEAKRQARRQDKAATQDFIVVDAPVRDPKHASMVFSASDPDLPPVFYEESLAETVEPDGGKHRKPKAETAQPVHTVKRYLGIADNPQGPAGSPRGPQAQSNEAPNGPQGPQGPRFDGPQGPQGTRAEHYFGPNYIEEPDL